MYEIRLLSVEREYRNGRALLGLIRFLHRYLLLNGYELALISATTRELALYEQMGFKSFHTLVGTEEAPSSQCMLPLLCLKNRVLEVL